MQVVLVMFRADGQRRSFSIARDMTVVGRREDCDLRIPLSDVSRKHCRLIKEGDVLRVEDLGSSNGTFHNGQRVQQAEIAAGDTLQIGPVVFVAQVDGAPADEDLQPVIAAPAEGAPEEALEEVGDADDAAGAVEPATVAADDGSFDPLEALNAEPEDSQFEFTLDETGEGGDAAPAEADADDSVVSLNDAPAEIEEEPVDLEESEHDRKA
jgi:pSer/pThr/pTyr-binding forkhead associated (FHA) protein